MSRSREARPGKYRVVMIIRKEEWVLRRALELSFRLCMA
jgi:hypothetical protein